MHAFLPLRALRAAAALAALASAWPACAQSPTAASADVFAYDRAAPLDLQSRPLEEREGVAVHAISYASPRGGRVTGRLFLPRGSGPFAGVILAHGMPGSSEMFVGRAVYIAKHGAVVIAIDAPFNRRQGPPITITPQDSAEQVQLVVDLQRAVDVLLARRDVDPARLAYVGRSYGGATGALFAGIERRLKTYILAVADAGVTTRFTAPGAPPPPAGEEARFRAWVAAMDPIEAYRWVGRADAPILFQNARRDQFVAVERAEALHALVTGPKEVKWYDTEHALNPAAHVDQLRWLSQQVGTTPPTAEDEAGPEIPAPPQQRQRP